MYLNRFEGGRSRTLPLAKPFSAISMDAGARRISFTRENKRNEENSREESRLGGTEQCVYLGTEEANLSIVKTWESRI